MAEVEGENGNKLEKKKFGLAVQVQNSVDLPYTMRPGMRISDTIVFAKPPAEAKTLTLELPKKGLGEETGEVLYRFPVPK